MGVNTQMVSILDEKSSFIAILSSHKWANIVIINMRGKMVTTQTEPILGIKSSFITILRQFMSQIEDVAT